MFNFTTQSVYNLISKTGPNKNMYVSDGPAPSLRIGNTRFDNALIESIQIKKPSKESLASVTFDLSKVIPSSDMGKTTGRIVIYVGLSMNCQDSFYANAHVYKGKPLFIEFPVAPSDAATTIAKRVKKLADKYLLFMTKEKILDIVVDKYDSTEATAYNTENGLNEGDDGYISEGDAKGTITISGVNGYQLIKKAVLQIYDPQATTVDCCTYDGNYEDVVTGVPVIYEIDDVTGLAKAVIDNDKEQKIDSDGQIAALEDNEVGILPGLEAFGDYNWIIHNLRLPTAANYYPWSPANRMGEMPVPGQVYTQFIITICKERDGIAGEIVGQRATSVTTHVLYVAGDAALNTSVTTTPADLVYKELKTLVTDATKFKTDADTVLVEPYKSVTD